MSGRWDGVDIGDLECREFVELVTEYLEGRLDPGVRADFEQHIAACAGCADYLDQIRAARRSLGQVRLDSISDSARDQLLTAFRTWRADRSGESS